MKRAPRKRKRTRKRRGHVNVGGSLWSLLKGAAQVGVKLGKSKRCKRMGAVGVGDAVSNFQRKTVGIMKRLRRQLPFLRLVLKEANRFKRQELLQHANAAQVNAISELVLTLLKNNIPVTPPIMAQLRPYKKVLRDLGRRQHSVKKRRQRLVSQKGRGLWQGLNNELCQCARRPQQR